MKRILIITTFAFCFCMNAISQATSLTVDCQTPGWLSSMINYSDQQTISDLTVTGKLTFSDMSFIGKMIKNQSLKRINLENVDIVSSDENKKNMLIQNIFKINDDIECHLEILKLPLSIDTIYCDNKTEVVGVFSENLYIDTLIVGGPNLTTLNAVFYEKGHYRQSLISRRVKSLILREGIEAISDWCLYSYSFDDQTLLSELVLPSTIKSIGDLAFCGFNLKKINLPNSIEKIGSLAFCHDTDISISDTNMYPDTLFLPSSIKYYSISAFDYPSKVYYFPESIEVIDNLYTQPYVLSEPSAMNIYMPIEFHLKSKTPPQFKYGDTWNLLINSTVYIPKGTLAVYQKSSPWMSANLIEEIFLEDIYIDKSKSLYVGDCVKIPIIFNPSDAHDKKVLWESSNDAVANVSQDGFVTANGYGVSTIKVSSVLKPEVNATCVVSVFEHTTGVQLSDTSLVIDLGTNKKMAAFTLPLEKSDNEIIWSSSDEDIATVDNNGKVSALKIGECEITATSVDGGFSASCKVNVIQRASKVELDKRETSVIIGENATLKATVSPDNTTDKTVLWTSRNTAIAEVDGSGVVTGKKAGKVYIVATAASNPEAKDSCEVTVLQPVTGITMSQEELTFTEIGQTKQLKATVSPDDASNKAVRWRSFNENVCSVSESGYVVAVGYGSAVITATSVDGGFVGTCICKVIEKAPDPIMGDVDNNREVNVLDIVKTVDYIMKRPIDNFYVSLADFDGDEKITVADLVEIVSIVSSQSQINGMVAASNIGSGKVCMTTNDDGTLSLGVKDSRMYIATQMVVELSDNQRLVDVSSIDGHNVVFRNIGGNRYSVISYSNQNNVYESSDRMINLAITGDGFVNVESVLAVDVDRRSVVFENNDVEYVTGIAEITVDFNQPTDIYTVGGVLIKRNATSTEGLPKGMYIINNKKYYKK